MSDHDLQALFSNLKQLQASHDHKIDELKSVREESQSLDDTISQLKRRLNETTDLYKTVQLCVFFVFDHREVEHCRQAVNKTRPDITSVRQEMAELLKEQKRATDDLRNLKQRDTETLEVFQVAMAQYRKQLQEMCYSSVSEKIESERRHYSELICKLKTDCEIELENNSKLTHQLNQLTELKDHFDKDLQKLTQENEVMIQQEAQLKNQMTSLTETRRQLMTEVANIESQLYEKENAFANMHVNSPQNMTETRTRNQIPPFKPGFSAATRGKFISPLVARAKPLLSRMNLMNQQYKNMNTATPPRDTKRILSPSTPKFVITEESKVQQEGSVLLDIDIDLEAD
ncbi:hypothetical protein RCL1_006907 [Eukaryota sp. TZLM3-RCL]